jgi:hypothetical protein
MPKGWLEVLVWSLVSERKGGGRPRAWPLPDCCGQGLKNGTVPTGQVPRAFIGRAHGAWHARVRLSERAVAT